MNDDDTMCFEPLTGHGAMGVHQSLLSGKYRGTISVWKSFHREQTSWNIMSSPTLPFSLPFCLSSPWPVLLLPHFVLTPARDARHHVALDFCDRQLMRANRSDAHALTGQHGLLAL